METVLTDERLSKRLDRILVNLRKLCIHIRDTELYPARYFHYESHNHAFYWAEEISETYLTIDEYTRSILLLLKERKVHAANDLLRSMYECSINIAYLSTNENFIVERMRSVLNESVRTLEEIIKYDIKDGLIIFKNITDSIELLKEMGDSLDPQIDGFKYNIKDQIIAVYQFYGFGDEDSAIKAYRKRYKEPSLYVHNMWIPDRVRKEPVDVILQVFINLALFIRLVRDKCDDYWRSCNALIQEISRQYTEFFSVVAGDDTNNKIKLTWDCKEYGHEDQKLIYELGGLVYKCPECEDTLDQIVARIPDI